MKRDSRVPVRVYRNSLHYARGVFVTRLPSTLLLFVFLNNFRESLPWYWYEIALSGAVALSLAMFLDPIWAARFRKLQVSNGEISLFTGWVLRDTRVIRLSNVTSVQVNEPLAQRVSNVRSIAISAMGSREVITMPALTSTDCDELCAIITEYRNADPEVGPRPVPSELVTTPDSGCESPEQAKRALYNASLRDTVATALSSGYPVAVVASVIALLQDYGEIFSLQTVPFSLDTPLTWLVGIVALFAVVVLSVGVKYWRFTMSIAPNGQLEVAYGVLERFRHSLAPGEIASIKLLRTPIDLIFGTTRLVVSTAHLGDSERTSLTFPSMGHKTVDRVVNELTGRSDMTSLSERRFWVLRGPVFIAAATIPVGLLLAQVDLVAALGGSAATLLLCTLAVRYLTGRIRIEDEQATMIYSSIGLAHSVVSYRSGTITTAIERKFPCFPIVNISLLGWAHSRVVHRVPAIGSSTFDAVVEIVRRSVSEHVAPNTIAEK